MGNVTYTNAYCKSHTAFCCCCGCLFFISFLFFWRERDVLWFCAYVLGFWLRFQYIEVAVSLTLTFRLVIQLNALWAGIIHTVWSAIVFRNFSSFFFLAILSRRGKFVNFVSYFYTQSVYINIYVCCVRGIVSRSRFSLWRILINEQFLRLMTLVYAFFGADSSVFFFCSKALRVRYIFS